MLFSKSTWTQRITGFLTLLLLGSLILTGAGCGGAGANGDGGDGNGDGNGGNDGTAAPAAPSSLEGTSGNSVVDLTWGAVGAGDLDGYNVYRDTESIRDLSSIDPQNESVIADTTGYPDTSAENGTTYFYVVTAVDTDGNESEPSGEVEKTPFDEPPSRP